MKKKIIFWGYPLHTDTLGYVWHSMRKAFDYLGYDTYWFSDNEFDSSFNVKIGEWKFAGLQGKKRGLLSPLKPKSIVGIKPAV